MRGFIHFLRTQGVVGLAVGFIIGSASQQFVNSLASDVLTPTVGIALSRFGNIASSTSTFAGQTFAWGHLISQFLNLVLIALVIYLAVTFFHAKSLDAPKDAPNKG